jgi:hypothetical protein
MGDAFVESKEEGSHNSAGSAVKGTATLPAAQIPIATSIDYTKEKVSSTP